MVARALGQSDLAGQTLGHYRLVERIGAGGMGVVYRAHDLHLECDVAIKVLPAGSLGDEDARKRFRREALALSQLNHPNIEVAHDFDTQDGLDFLVTEYIPGHTLEVALASRLSEKEILELGAQLAEGLAAAHEQGVVHRDLKPSNLLVTGDGRLKILDFGLAKTIRKPSPTAATESLSQTQGTVGTLPYMAPEQVEGAKADARSDIWAAGAVLYEMAARQRPFPGSGVQLADAIRFQEPRPPRQLNSELSVGLEGIILRCLEKDPDLRYQTARELALHLRRLQRGEMPLPAPPRRRRRRWWAFAAGALVLLVASLLAADPAGLHEKIRAWLAGPSPEPLIQSIAVLPFADMSAEKDQEYLADGISEELLNALARTPGLRVAARTSSFRFKGKNASVEDIGRELHVDSVLEGSVHRQGTRVRINVQLVKVADGFELWSQSYDREMNDVFAVQDEIASSVAGSLKLTLLRGTAPAPPTTSAEAYNAYLQAQYFRERRTQEDLERSVGYYQQALRSDPGYALAWTGLSETRMLQAIIAYVPLDQACSQAREASERALALNAHLAESNTVMGSVKLLCDWDWTGADASFQRAAALEPGNLAVLGGTARIDAAMGRLQDALALRRQIAERDPLNPRAHINLGLAAYQAGSLQEAAAALQKALELNPDNPAIHFALGEVYLAQSRPQEALAEMERETAAPWRLQGLALTYHALGQKERSDAALAELVAKYPGEMAYQIAEVYAFRGENGRAFEWLERAYDQRHIGLIDIGSDALLKGLRRDPRYANLLARMRLPSPAAGRPGSH